MAISIFKTNGSNMAWRMKNRVPELFASRKAKAEAEGNTLSLKDIERATGISYPSVNKWVKDQIISYDSKLAEKFSDFFGEPATQWVQVEEPDE